MKFLRHVAIDIAITVFIIIVVAAKSDALNIALVVLTVLLLLARLSLFSNKEMGKQLSKKTGVPEWFYHVLNGVNVLLLLIGQKWSLAAAWVIIWYLSWKTLQRAKKTPATQKRKR